MQYKYKSFGDICTSPVWLSFSIQHSVVDRARPYLSFSKTYVGTIVGLHIGFVIAHRRFVVLGHLRNVNHGN